MDYEVIVIGGGVMGLATAHALLVRGMKRVLVLEQYSVGHDRAPSTDATKAIRYEYAGSEMYSRMAGRSIELWRRLEGMTASQLYVNCGVICWGRGDAPHTRASFETLSRLGLPIEELSPGELARRYPQFDPADMSYVTWNPEGGFLRASDCLAAFAFDIERRGGEVREQAEVVDVRLDGTRAAVTLRDGDTVLATRLAITAGPWSTTLLPQFGITLPLTAHKQQLLYIAGLPTGFSPTHLPVFLNLDHDFYGFPLDQDGLLKVSLHDPGPVVDPDDRLRPDEEYAAELWRITGTYMPEVVKRGRPARSRVCMYTMTPDEDFILDRLPGHGNAVFGAGFSGHGFKFGPFIGEMLATMLLGEEPEFSMQPFSMNRFAQ